MSIADRLVLPDDVQIVTVEHLASTNQQLLDWEQGQYIVTRPGARANAKLIDNDAAQLLERFRTPTTVIEAILAQSQAQSIDPEILLDEAFPLIQTFFAVGYLVNENSILAKPIVSNYASGEHIGCYTIVEAIHVLEDTEVYRAHDPQGTPIAIKLARRGESHTLANEASILEYLQGVGAPHLLTYSAKGDRPFLAMTWMDGETAARAAAQLRISAPEKLLALCLAILDAYVELHSRGILHGDVHPKNIQVDRNNVVALIDFGLARGIDLIIGNNEVVRGVFPQFCDPEYAAAICAGIQPPPATPASEQYSLAATLYYLITGHYYLDFSIDREIFFHQILEADPLSFTACKVAPQAKLEAVLRKALGKQSNERFPSMSAFRDAFGNAMAVSCINTSSVTTMRLQFLSQYGSTGCLFTEGLPNSPTCSVSFGAAGIAYAFYRLACIEESADHLAIADLWLSRAKRNATCTDAFINEQLDLTPKVLGQISLYHTQSGLHCVDALIQIAFGNETAARQASQAFVAASQAPCTEMDLTLGLSSTLIGCALLLEILPDDERLWKLGKTRLQQVWERLNTYPPIPESNDVPWLGIAHGWAGYLFATLRWCQSTGQPVPSMLVTRLAELAECSKGTDLWRYWSRRPPAWSGRDVAWKGWCHGSAGYVHLWLLAATVFNDPIWLELALAVGRHASDIENSGPNLCCGLTGQAYAMLSLYQTTSESEWLNLANQMAMKALKITTPKTMIAGSLYKGDVGLALLESDLSRPDTAVMPLFG